MSWREFSIFIIFLIHIHVLMLCRKFQLIPIKIRFFRNFQCCSKIRPKTMYYSTGTLAKVHQKWQGENSLFLLHFLMHIHVLILCRKFELIPIKIVFFTNFESCSKIWLKTLYYKYRDFGQISSKMTRREFSIFITFSDAYTCTYIV